MINPKPCPVCQRQTSNIERWRGYYLCAPCANKYEKIDEMIKNGQVLTPSQLDDILSTFGKEELEVIKNSKTVRLTQRKGRKRRVAKNNSIVSVKPGPKRRKKI